MTHIERIKHELRNAGSLAHIHPEMFSTYGLLKAGDVLRLIAAAEQLEYALEVFNETCGCGECAPCRQAEIISGLLKELK